LVNIVLVEPEIPANTGNIARTCAVTGSHLHLIRPLGFDISERAVRRAGLTYWPLVDLHVYDSLEDFFTKNPAPDLWLATSKAPRSYTEVSYADGCWLFFGKETAGLPESLRLSHPERCVRIPMLPVEEARCLNLSNSVAVLTYEALRQQGFPELSGVGEMAASK
jgi:tRNA (cytidine/uridine-2'-O-)-methyltransferase